MSARAPGAGSPPPGPGACLPRRDSRVGSAPLAGTSRHPLRRYTRHPERAQTPRASGQASRAGSRERTDDPHQHRPRRRRRPPPRRRRLGRRHGRRDPRPQPHRAVGSRAISHPRSSATRRSSLSGFTATDCPTTSSIGTSVAESCTRRSRARSMPDASASVADRLGLLLAVGVELELARVAAVVADLRARGDHAARRRSAARAGARPPRASTTRCRSAGPRSGAAPSGRAPPGRRTDRSRRGARPARVARPGRGPIPS